MRVELYMSVVFHASHTIGPTPSCQPAGHCTWKTPAGLTGAVGSRCVLAYVRFSWVEAPATSHPPPGRQEKLCSQMRAIPAGSCACPRLGGGSTATVIVALPLWPSLVAVIVAEPVVTPVTSPTALTVAIAPALLLQLTLRPLSTLPLASFSTALSCSVCPDVTLAVVGLTVTTATGAVEAAVVAGTRLESAPNVAP